MREEQQPEGEDVKNVNGELKNDVEGGNGPDLSFSNASIRAGFTRKVFGIVTIMLLINVIMTATVFVFEDLRVFLQKNTWIQIIALVLFLVTYFILVCCSSVGRSFPCNIILLFVFTFAAGAMLMVICANVPPHTVLLTLATTTLTCFAIILFASQTTYDITSHIFIIFAVSIAVFIFGIGLAIMSIFIYIKALHIIFAAIVCVLFMVHLALDIQMILGGRKYEISPEEYVYASLMLFVDIYEIFISMLTLFDAAR